MTYSAAFGRFAIVSRERCRRYETDALVIDRRGVVRWKIVEINYKVRPTNEMIMEAVRRAER